MIRKTPSKQVAKSRNQVMNRRNRPLGFEDGEDSGCIFVNLLVITAPRLCQSWVVF